MKNCHVLSDISEKGFNSSCCFDRNQIKDFYLDLNRKYKLLDYSIYPENIVNECAVRSPYSYTIGPEGELYTCWENIGRKEYIIGKLTNKGEIEVNNEKEYNKYIGAADYLNDKKCLECFFFPICNGGCPEKRLLNKYKKTKFDICSVHKDNIEEILMNHYSQITNKQN